MKIRKCSNLNCHVDDGETCAIGHTAFEKCPAWHIQKVHTQPMEATINPSADRVPWTSSALGLSDVFPIAVRSKHRLIGVIGAHDSGKTTLLTATYLQLYERQHFIDAYFSGSMTLGAWEALAAWMRFDDAARRPMFPPHTPRGNHRVPGLLHFSLRNSAGEFRDFLITDAPGEWFKEWALNEDTQLAVGARWVVKHADVFLLLADCERLAGTNRGSTRDELRTLIERLGKYVAQRPVLFVWAKSDFKIAEGIRKKIQDALRKNLPNATEISATIVEPKSLFSVMAESIKQGWDAPYSLPIVERVTSSNPFYAFRGHHVKT